MKPLPPFAAVFGLGAPELIVIAIILAMLLCLGAFIANGVYRIPKPPNKAPEPTP